MTWENERDLLIAQTMAFVESVTGTKPEPEAAIELNPLDEPEAAIELTPLDELDTVERPVAVVPTSHAMRLPAIAVREEIQRRVAAFRAHQQLFQRERDDYFNSVLAKAGERTSSQPKVQQNK